MVVDQLTAEQLQVGRHVRMRCALGSIDVHASDTVLGVWLQGGSGGRPANTLAAYVGPGQSPAIAFYPPADYWGPKEPGKPRQPFAFSGSGLQVPHQDGSVTVLSLEELSNLVLSYKRQQ